MITTTSPPSAESAYALDPSVNYRTEAPWFEVCHISKTFPGVRALDDVNLYARQGEVLGLVGENGAGKSTLMRIIAGVYPAGSYEGEIRFEGGRVNFRGVADAKRLGIGIIHQELNLVPEHTAAQNIFLNDEPLIAGAILNEHKMIVEARALLDTIGVDVDPTAVTGRLPVGKQQMVEIAKALKERIRILILDEPTSSLTEVEVEKLFLIIRGLKEKGITCIYISHRLREVFKLCDRVAILKDGASVGSYPITELTREKMVSLMVGRNVSELFARGPAVRTPGEWVLEVKGLSVRDPERPGRFRVRTASFKARKGELLVFAGLMGAGRSELMLAIYGAYPPDRVTGEVLVNGTRLSGAGPAGALNGGIALATEDRKSLGLHLQMNVRENITLASLQKVSRAGVIDRPREDATATRFREMLGIKTPSLSLLVSNLSGGNQQKVVVGKALAAAPRVLILDEPTRGVDVGAKAEIYALVRRLIDDGVAVIVVSSEMLEVLGIADRILVMREGEIAGELGGAEATEEAVMMLATGEGSHG